MRVSSLNDLDWLPALKQASLAQTSLVAAILQTSVAQLGVRTAAWHHARCSAVLPSAPAFSSGAGGGVSDYHPLSDSVKRFRQFGPELENLYGYHYY